ncbi:hypothetical protein KIN20_035025 [Parelaphostrongylus tenuis]|uniref:Uncharacterized protein n=1 Tax=Parelaphostrongylus tenuis TaxID=148309 RepID=A0AAD5RAJ4_PARTN|nr:hypothetical protein KIN20_035025 [Parelaphostrongylus tenuis]
MKTIQAKLRFGFAEATQMVHDLREQVVSQRIEDLRQIVVYLTAIITLCSYNS